MVRHGLKHIFQKPTPDIDSSDRTQQLRAKTIYAGTVDLAKTLISGNNRVYQTYNGPYEVVTQAGTGDSKLIASRTYDDMLSITKGKVLLNQLPFNSLTQDYYQKNFAKGQMYEGNYNRFDPSFNFTGHTGCNNSVLVYDISSTGFTGRASYDTNGGFIGATGPIGDSENNKHIFVDPNHCYYSNPCLLDASYTRFVNPALSGLTGPAQFNAQQIISADQYRGFSFPMPDFNLICEQPNLNQSVGPLFCPPTIPTLSNFSTANENYSPTPFSLKITPPSSNSGGAFSYFSSDTSVVAIHGDDGDTAIINKAGIVTITAYQAAHGSFKSGSISTIFTVNRISPNLSLSLPAVNTSTIPFSLTQNTSTYSLAPVSYKSSNPSVATISGLNLNTLTINGIGSTTITASQAAYGNYTADSIDLSLNITVAQPNLSLSSLPTTLNKDTTTQPQPLSLSLTEYTTSSSLAPVSYTSSNSSIATVSGTSLSIHDSGIITITATQASNDIYSSDTTSAQLIVLYNLYSQDATNSVTFTEPILSPEIPNLKPGITLYGGTFQYSKADVSKDLILKFKYNSGPDVTSQSFTITQDSGQFDFTFNPPIEWKYEIQYNNNDDIVWPNAWWYQLYSSVTLSPRVIYNSYDSKLSRWVGTLTVYNTPPT